MKNNRIPKQPPISNAHVALGCELFSAKPRPLMLRGDNPPLNLKMEPSPGSEIGDCFDHAARIVRKIDCVVNFDFNGVFCGVRPCDVVDRTRKARFVEVYRNELSKPSGFKICFANP